MYCIMPRGLHFTCVCIFENVALLSSEAFAYKLPIRNIIIFWSQTWSGQDWNYSFSFVHMYMYVYLCFASFLVMQPKPMHLRKNVQDFLPEFQNMKNKISKHFLNSGFDAFFCLFVHKRDKSSLDSR